MGPRILTRHLVLIPRLENHRPNKRTPHTQRLKRRKYPYSFYLFRYKWQPSVLSRIPCSSSEHFSNKRERERERIFIFIFILFLFLFLFFVFVVVGEDARSFQWVDRVAAGGAGGCWLPDSVAEDNVGGAGETVRGDQCIHGVRASRRPRAIGLHTQQPVSFDPQVNISN